MAKRFNPVWIDKMRDAMNHGQVIDYVASETAVAKWLITSRASRGIPFKVYTLGAGVKRITTETNICPCCKKLME